MNEQEKHAASQEERKEKIRARYKGVDRSELEFIPAKQKEKLFEDAGTKRVCAYCRVSTDDANQTSSYELQKNHYTDFVNRHPNWQGGHWLVYMRMREFQAPLYSIGMNLIV